MSVGKGAAVGVRSGGTVQTHTKPKRVAGEKNAGSFLGLVAVQQRMVVLLADLIWNTQRRRMAVQTIDIVATFAETFLGGSAKYCSQLVTKGKIVTALRFWLVAKLGGGVICSYAHMVNWQNDHIVKWEKARISLSWLI